LARYRTRLQIIAEILEIVRNGARKTHIMYKANLSYKLLCKYLNEVLECKLARIDDGDSYVIAPKGKKFLQSFHAYAELRERVKEDVKQVNEKRMLLEQIYTNSGARNIGLRDLSTKSVSRR